MGYEAWGAALCFAAGVFIGSCAVLIALFILEGGSDGSDD